MGVLAPLLVALAFIGCQSAGPRDEPEAPAVVGNASIEISLVGIRTAGSSGPVRIAVWASADDFMREGAWIRAATVPADASSAPVLIEGLPAGEYAVSAFHDVTDCGAFRRGAFGLPRDPWAVSNGGSAWLPPSWDRSRFHLPEGTTRIELDFTHRDGARP